LDPQVNLALNNVSNEVSRKEGLQNRARKVGNVLNTLEVNTYDAQPSPRRSAGPAPQLTPGSQLAPPTSPRRAAAGHGKAIAQQQHEQPSAPFRAFFNREDDLETPLLPPSYEAEKEYRRQRLVARMRGNVACARSDTRGIICAMHKKVANKIHPVNADVSMTDGSRAPGNVNWKQECLRREALMPIGTGLFDQRYLTKRFSSIEKGSRLTTERLAAITTGLELWPVERLLLECMLKNREAVLAFSFEHLGKVKPEVAPPQEIRTVQHEPWQHPGFKLNPSLRHVVEGMLRERLMAGTLEFGHGAYRNPYFLVAKGGQKAIPAAQKQYRLINAAQKYNQHTIRDANLPPDTDGFSEDFAGCEIASLVDVFSGYDQVELDEKSRDLTAFDTPLGLLRQTTLPQGATNSVSQFVRIMNLILMDHISHDARPFLDDVGIKGPKTRYNNEVIHDGKGDMRRFVVEHIVTLDKVLCDMERAGLTIHGGKLQLLCTQMKIVGYVTNAQGRHPDAARIQKLADWPEPTSIKDVRVMLGMATYYHQWVDEYKTLLIPLFKLLRKDAPFKWEDEHRAGWNLVVKALTDAPALVSIDYTEGAGLIIAAVDSSGIGWGCCVMQCSRKDPSLRHPARFESGVWNSAEQKYDAGKRECLGILKALRKLKPWLYGVYFQLEIDANTLVHQLNKAASDLPNSVMTRWLSWIHLFDFDVIHVPGKRHSGPDSLSRRPVSAIDSNENFDDDDDMIDKAFFMAFAPNLGQGAVCATTMSPVEDADLVEGWEGLTHSSRCIVIALTGSRPEGLSDSSFRQLKKKCRRFMTKNKMLFHQERMNAPLQRVLDDPDARSAVVASCHDDQGHRSVEGTYAIVRRRYWWDGVYGDVYKYCRSCPQCSYYNGSRRPGPMQLPPPPRVGERWYGDAVHLEKGVSLFIVREALSRWPEARVFHHGSKDISSKQIAKFLYEDVFCRWGMMAQIVLDNAKQNLGEVSMLLKGLGVHRVKISAYHPQSNGTVEAGHKPIIAALAKLTNGGLHKSSQFLAAVMWAERTTAVSTTGLTPAEVMIGREAILPIELEHTTYNTQGWGEIYTHEDLLAQRARALDYMTLKLDDAMLRQDRLRTEAKSYHDWKNNCDNLPDLKVEDLVMLYRSELRTSFSHKLVFRWRGPFRVASVLPGGVAYRIKELDGAILEGTFPKENLKPVPDFRQPEEEPPDNTWQAVDDYDPDDHNEGYVMIDESMGMTQEEREEYELLE
jgi:hypothetical protein